MRHRTFLPVLVLLLWCTCIHNAQAKRYVGRYSAKKLHSTRKYTYREYRYYSPSAKKYLHHYAIYYQSQPRYVYYYNPRKKVYWGRFDLNVCGYSLLAAKDKKMLVKDIPGSAFPEPADLPAPEPEMSEQMMPPPETFVSTKAEERQYYSKWFYEKPRNRLVCYYFYKSNQRDQSYQRQTVVYYPQKDKRLYLYYFNEEKGKFWGRCVSPLHPEYDKSVMVWNFAKDALPGKSWGPLTKGDPEIPGSKDRATMKMYPRPIPDPPFGD